MSRCKIFISCRACKPLITYMRIYQICFSFMYIFWFWHSHIRWNTSPSSANSITMLYKAKREMREWDRALTKGNCLAHRRKLACSLRRKGFWLRLVCGLHWEHFPFHGRTSSIFWPFSKHTSNCLQICELCTHSNTIHHLQIWNNQN